MSVRAAFLPFLVSFLLFPMGAPAGAQPLFTLTIPLEPGRQVRVALPWGEERQIGEVISIPRTTVYPAFSASRWGTPGCVVACAVNAIHLLVAKENGNGRMVSLLPSYTNAPAARPAGAVVVDGIGGMKLFGAWAPPVGSRVYVVDEKGGRAPLSMEALFSGRAKALEIPVEARYDCPYYVDIENRLEGIVTAVWPDRSQPIARVVHPVSGVGGFEGSQFQSLGRIRANHPGVICVSTKLAGGVGGFQIVPLLHAKAPGMKMAWYEPEWMIVEPLEPGRAGPGTEPLFSGFLVPGPNPRDGAERMWDAIVRIPYVLVRIDGGDWRPMPEVHEKDNGPGCILRRVTHLRIVYPFLLAPPPTPTPMPLPTPVPSAVPLPSAHPVPGAGGNRGGGPSGAVGPSPTREPKVPRPVPSKPAPTPALPSLPPDGEAPIILAPGF